MRIPSLTEPIDLLRRSRIFEDMARDELDTLAAVMTRQEIPTDEPLFAQGAHGDSMAMVASGSFRVEVSRPGRDPETISTIGPGDLLGELTCIEPAPRSASVIADEDSTVMLLDGPTLRTLKSDNPILFSAVLTGVSARVTDRIRATDEQIDDLLAVQARAGGLMTSVAPTLRSNAPPDNPDPATAQQGRMLRSIGDEGLQEILESSPRRELGAGEVLCNEGDPGSSCFIVLSGALEVLREVGETMQRVATLAEGCIAGQLSLLDFAPRSATLRTSRQTELIELSRQAYLELLAKQSPTALRLQEQLVMAGIRQLRAATGVLSRLTTLASHLYPNGDASPEERLATPRAPAKTPRMPTSLVKTLASAKPTDQGAEEEAAPAAAPPSAEAPPPPPDVRDTVHETKPRQPALHCSDEDEFRDTIVDESHSAELEKLRRAEADRFRTTMSVLKTALGEWGVSIEDLDEIAESQRG